MAAFIRMLIPTIAGFLWTLEMPQTNLSGWVRSAAAMTDWRASMVWSKRTWWSMAGVSRLSPVCMWSSFYQQVMNWSMCPTTASLVGKNDGIVQWYFVVRKADSEKGLSSEVRGRE